MIILTENNQSHPFYPTKIILPTHAIACDYAIQFKFTIGHIPATNNTAADYLEFFLKRKVIPRFRKDIPTTPIELNVQSAGVTAEEKPFYTEIVDKTEKQIWQRKRYKIGKPQSINYQTFLSIILAYSRVKILNWQRRENFRTLTL